MRKFLGYDSSFPCRKTSEFKKSDDLENLKKSNMYTRAKLQGQKIEKKPDFGVDRFLSSSSTTFVLALRV
jgi:hypothetical protein